MTSLLVVLLTVALPLGDLPLLIMEEVVVVAAGEVTIRCKEVVVGVWAAEEEEEEEEEMTEGNRILIVCLEFADNKSITFVYLKIYYKKLQG